MAISPNYFAETTDFGSLDGIIDSALRTLQVSGTVLLREAYAPPWAIAVPNQEHLSQLLQAPSGTRVVAFHLVEYGHCTLVRDDGKELLLKAGEIAICFSGMGHRLCQGPATEVMPIAALLTGSANPYRPETPGGAIGASLICGTFLLRHTALNPLFAALPPLSHVSLSRPGELHNLTGVAREIAVELERRAPAADYIVERLLEVLLAEVLRAHLESVPTGERGWFQGVKDTVVGRAISAIHMHPGKKWSVRRLAETVSMSPSRFAARFVETVGESPMAYVTKWRMHMACRYLRTTLMSVDQISMSIGYESQAAFSRAFKKHLGVPPAVWRSQNSDRH